MDAKTQGIFAEPTSSLDLQDGGPVEEGNEKFIKAQLDSNLKNSNHNRFT